MFEFYEYHHICSYITFKILCDNRHSGPRQYEHNYMYINEVPSTTRLHYEIRCAMFCPDIVQSSSMSSPDFVRERFFGGELDRDRLRLDRDRLRLSDLDRLREKLKIKIEE